MAEFTQKYGTTTSIGTTVASGASAEFSTLANGSTAISGAVDNSSNKFAEVLVEIKLGLTGTPGTVSWVDVRILASLDGGTTYGTWNTPLCYLPAIDLANGGDNPVYHARFAPSERWKLAIRNYGGAALDAGTASYQGITYLGV